MHTEVQQCKRKNSEIWSIIKKKIKSDHYEADPRLEYVTPGGIVSEKNANKYYNSPLLLHPVVGLAPIAKIFTVRRFKFHKLLQPGV
jgi:hypothetical protein